MEWLNIHSSTLDAPEFVGSDPVRRATWLCLLRYCAGQENGGTISSCKSWPDRKWQQLCRVTQAETQAETQLWHWECESLVVWRYPVEKEDQIKRLRIAGGKSSPAKVSAAQANGSKGGRPPITQQETHGKPIEGDGKGKEKGMEVEGNGTTHCPGQSGTVRVISSDEINFTTFWNAYPRKVGKGAAQKAWKNAKDKPDIKAIVAAIESAKSSEQWKKDGGQFIPHPSTWLNAKRWDDSPTIEIQTPQSSDMATPEELDAYLKAKGIEL